MRPLFSLPCHNAVACISTPPSLHSAHCKTKQHLPDTFHVVNGGIDLCKTNADCGTPGPPRSNTVISCQNQLLSPPSQQSCCPPWQVILHPPNIPSALRPSRPSLECLVPYCSSTDVTRIHCIACSRKINIVNVYYKK